MKTRKQRNMEIERQKKRQNKLYLSGVVAVGFVILLAIGWVVWDIQNRNWIMTFNGERVATSEFEFFNSAYQMFMEPEDARSMAMDELVNSLVVMDRAQAHGISLPADERESLAADAQMQQQMMQSPVSVDRITDFFGVGYMQERLMDIYVPSYTPDPEEFEAELAEYVRTNSFLMHFDGRNVSDELRFLTSSYEIFAEPEMAREIALSELLNTLTILDRAEMHGLELTPEEMEQLIQQAEGQRMWMGDVALSNERIAEIFGVHHLQSRLMEIYLAGFEIDQDAFAAELADYLINNRDNYVRNTIKYVEVESVDEATRLFDNIDAPEWGSDTFDLDDFLSFHFLEHEDTAIIRSLPVGGLHIAQQDGTFFPIQLVSRTPANDAEMTASFAAQYENTARHQAFSALSQGWLEDIEYSVEADEEGFREDFIWARRFEAFVEILDDWRSNAHVEINERAYAAL